MLLFAESISMPATFFFHSLLSQQSLFQSTTNERELTSNVLRDLNIQQFGHTFVDSLVKSCEDLDKKKTKMRDQRNILKKCRDQVNQQLAENIALHTRMNC